MKCKREKKYYDCINAENRSLKNRVGTRKHKWVSEENIEIINEIVSPLVLRGRASITSMRQTRFLRPSVASGRLGDSSMTVILKPRPMI
jgi:hypothetical protein